MGAGKFRLTRYRHGNVLFPQDQRRRFFGNLVIRIKTPRNFLVLRNTCIPVAKVKLLLLNVINTIQRHPMKQNTFYLIAGIVGLIEVGIFWLSVEMRSPFLIMGGFIIGFLSLYALWRTVTDRKMDERTLLISEKAKSKTLEVFWVLFFAVSLGTAVFGFATPLRIPHGPRPGMNVTLPPPDLPVERPFLGYIGILQLILLVSLIFLYLGFRIYYARKYGDWDDDEE